jgi:hypothetical protein
MGLITVPNCISYPSTDIGDPIPEECGPFSTVRNWLLALAKDEVAFRRPRSYRVQELISDAVQKVATSALFSSSSGSACDGRRSGFYHRSSTHRFSHNILVSFLPKTQLSLLQSDWDGAVTMPIIQRVTSLVCIECLSMRD